MDYQQSNQFPLPSHVEGALPCLEKPELTVTTMSAERSWPKITIVTPSFNQGMFLEETIRSVLLQGYPNLEYIVIDGGSTDDSVEIIQRYQDQLAYWISEPDSGQCHALNKGFSLATGDWLAWLNSDDIYLPGALWAVARAIRDHEDCHWIVGRVDVVDTNLNTISVFEPFCHTDNWLDFICTKRKNGTSLPQPGSFWSKNAWDVAGQLDETLHYAMDHDFWGRLAYHGFRPICLQQTLALFRLHMLCKSSQGECNFIFDERAVIDKWIGKVSNPDACILINYRRTLKLRFFVQRIRHRIECYLSPIYKIARLLRKSVLHYVSQNSQ